jgi:hypothetical protein
MASIPNGGDPITPITESQRLGDPGAPGTLTSRLEPQPSGPSLSSATADSARHDNARNRWLSKKILRPIVLAAVGVGLFFGALALYSSPGELSAPSFTTIQLQSTFPISIITYDVRQISPSIAEVRIAVQLPPGVIHPPSKAPAPVVWLELPPGTGFKTCPKDTCFLDPVDKEYWSSWTPDFAYENLSSDSGYAWGTFFVKAHNFGYVFNNINASAALPRVDYNGPGSAALDTRYNVISADGYDWSAFQPQLINSTQIFWDEPVTGGATAGIVAVGINHANEAKDSNETFFAGALIGLAGGALLAAVQEALHAND